MSESFSGFGPQAMSFLAGLEADNSKTYFDANRDTYKAQVQEPLKSLVVSLGGAIANELDPAISFEPKVGKSMFRINRDLRFSKDKTPYNAHLDVIFWHGEKPRTSPGYMLRIRPDIVHIAVGVFGLADATLTRYRDAIVGDAGEELESRIANAKKQLRGGKLSDPQRKRVPRGYNADHPRSHFLLSDGLHLSVEPKTPASVTSGRFVDFVMDRFTKLAPVHDWLVTNTQ